MGEGIVFLEQAQQYINIAEEMLEKKDTLGFIENISYATLLSKNDNAIYAKIIYLKARGLFIVREYDKFLKILNEALKYNTGLNEIKLLKYKGLVFTYHGKYDMAIELFEKLIEQIEDFEIRIGLYINIIGTCLVAYRNGENDKNHLDKAFEYLNIVNKFFDKLESKVKRKLICINLSEYYYLTSEYDKAIEMQEKALQYCEEKDLPEIYNNLAESYLEIDGINKVEKYLEQAEVLGEKYKNKIEVAKSFYTNAIYKIKSDEWLRAIDSLYLALEYFISAEALTYAYKCLRKILEVAQKFNNICLDSLHQNVKRHLKETHIFEKI